MKNIFQLNLLDNYNRQMPGDVKNSVFYFNLTLFIVLLLIAGITSGLTLGLLSIDRLKLEILLREGTDEEKRYVRKLYPILRRQHLVLVTLLITNASCVEAMPIFLDRISSPAIAIIVSVIGVLVFGEIIPQGVCKPYALVIGYYSIPLLYFIGIIFFPVAWPVSKLMDTLLHHEYKLYERSQLKVLLDLHGPNGFEMADTVMSTYDDIRKDKLHSAKNDQANYGSLGGITFSKDTSMLLFTNQIELQNRFAGDVEDRLGNDALTANEVMVMKNALDLEKQTARDVMEDLDSSFTLSTDQDVDIQLMEQMSKLNESHVPVYLGGECMLVCAILNVKRFIFFYEQFHEEARTIGAWLLHRFLFYECFSSPVFVNSSVPLYSIVKYFQLNNSGATMFVMRRDTSQLLSVSDIRRRLSLSKSHDYSTEKSTEEILSSLQVANTEGCLKMDSISNRLFRMQAPVKITF